MDTDKKVSLPDADSDISQDLLSKLSRLAWNYKKALYELNEQTGLSPNELGLMLVLYYHPDIDTANQLVKELGTTKGLASRSVDSLVKKGLVKTVHDEKDKRVIHISLCEEAQKICYDAHLRRHSFYEKAMDGISKEELFNAVSVIEKMVENVL